MITLNQACKMIEKKVFPCKICSILDVKRGWVIWECGENGEELDLGSGYFVSKITGEISTYFPPDHVEEYLEGVTIELPEEFKCKLVNAKANQM